MVTPEEKPPDSTSNNSPIRVGSEMEVEEAQQLNLREEETIISTMDADNCVLRQRRLAFYTNISNGNQGTYRIILFCFLSKINKYKWLDNFYSPNKLAVMQKFQLLYSLHKHCHNLLLDNSLLSLFLWDRVYKNITPAYFLWFQRFFFSWFVSSIISCNHCLSQPVFISYIWAKCLIPNVKFSDNTEYPQCAVHPSETSQPLPSTSSREVHQVTDCLETNDTCSIIEKQESFQSNNLPNDQNGITIKLKYINDDVKLVDGKLDEMLGDFKKYVFKYKINRVPFVFLPFG